MRTGGVCSRPYDAKEAHCGRETVRLVKRERRDNTPIGRHAGVVDSRKPL
jgi:hypothetical protein